MKQKKPVYFHHKRGVYPADGIVAIKQLNERDVEVRYGTKQEPVLLTDTTVEKVTAAIDAAKANADSA